MQTVMPNYLIYPTTMPCKCGVLFFFELLDVFPCFNKIDYVVLGIARDFFLCFKKISRSSLELLKIFFCVSKKFLWRLRIARDFFCFVTKLNLSLFASSIKLEIFYQSCHFFLVIILDWTFSISLA